VSKRERDPAGKVLEQRGQVYKQINLTEKTTHELMQCCVVAPRPRFTSQKRLLKLTTWISTLVCEPTW